MHKTAKKRGNTRRLMLAGLISLLVAVLLLTAYSTAIPQAHAQESNSDTATPPPGDCWGEVLSDDPLHCYALARIHRCGAALGLEQGVRAVGRDGPRSIPINGAGGGLWLSLGAPMAVLGSGAGAGSAGQYAGEDNRGPGRCDSVGRLGSLVDGSGAVGAVRQAMAGLAIEPGRE